MAATSEKLHLPKVDVLRGIAILLVFSSHFDAGVLGPWAPHWEGIWAVADRKFNTLQAVMNGTIFNGAMGVYIFFIVSGLCIRLSQRNSANFTIGRFYWRRFWRIYPPYLLALLLMVVVKGVNIWHWPGNLDFLTHLFMVHNLWSDFRLSISVPFWTLGAEAQLYLLYPVLLWAWARFGKWKTLALLLALSFAPDIFGGKEFRALLHLPPIFGQLYNLPTKLWFTWALGFMIADQLHDGTPPYDAPWIVIGVLLFAAGLSYHFKPLVHFDATISAFALLFLMSKYLNARAEFSWSPRWLAALGLCSYSFYLYFDSLILPILAFLRDTVQIHNTLILYLLGYCVALGVIWGISWLLWRIVELPSIAAGRRLWPSAPRNVPQPNPGT